MSDAPPQEPSLSYYIEYCRIFLLAKLSVSLVAFLPLIPVELQWLQFLQHKCLCLVHPAFVRAVLSSALASPGTTLYPPIGLLVRVSLS